MPYLDPVVFLEQKAYCARCAAVGELALLQVAASLSRELVILHIQLQVPFAMQSDLFLHTLHPLE